MRALRAVKKPIFLFRERAAAGVHSRKETQTVG